MKRVVFFCILAFGLMSLASCRKDQPVYPVLPGQGVSIGTDDSAVLLSNLVFTDENGNLDGYVSGFGFNAADPGEISIHSETIETAQELFRSWIPDGVNALEEGENLVWTLTDTLGVSQGAVKLVPGGNKGAVAHLELPGGFPLVTSVSFIPRTSMPENAELDFDEALEDFFFGNIVNLYPSDFKDNNAPHGSGIFCVIQEYDQDTNTSGILLSLPDYEHKIDGIYASEWEEWVEKYLRRGRKISELQGPIGKAYRKYRKYIDAILDGGPYLQTHGDHWFAARLDGGGFCIYNLAKNTTDSYRVNSWWGWRWAPDFYDCQAYFFTLEKGSNGVYKVVYK